MVHYQKNPLLCEASEHWRNVNVRHCRIGEVWPKRRPAAQKNAEGYHFVSLANIVSSLAAGQQPLGVDLGDLESMYEQ